MDKQEIETKLLAAFEQGFWPKQITKFQSASPLRIVEKEGEPDRIVIASRTTEQGGRQHNHQYIFSLEEAQALLSEYDHA